MMKACRPLCRIGTIQQVTRKNTVEARDLNPRDLVIGKKVAGARISDQDMISSPQLSSSMAVKAALALANRMMVTAVLVHRGNAEAGSILVRLDYPDGSARIEQRQLDLDGSYQWQDVTGDHALNPEEAEARLERELRYDPDLWIIAVDAVNGANPFRDL
jgi:hypothetical protein